MIIVINMLLLKIYNNQIRQLEHVLVIWHTFKLVKNKYMQPSVDVNIYPKPKTVNQNSMLVLTQGMDK